VRYQLKTPYRDGTTGDWRSHVIFEPLDFIARLAALVPKPRVNLTRFDEKHPSGNLWLSKFMPDEFVMVCLCGAAPAGWPSTKQPAPRDNNTRLTK
jgi:hypothetical protein